MGVGGSKRKEESCMDGSSTMSVLYANAQSVNNKINELRAVVVEVKPDVVALTESWTERRRRRRRPNSRRTSSNPLRDSARKARTKADASRPKTCKSARGKREWAMKVG